MTARARQSFLRPFARPHIHSTRRTFTTTPRFLIKEDADRSPEQIENAKQQQLKEQSEGKGRWREDLASHGESNIAADKDKVHDHQSHIEQLQQETKKKGDKGEISPSVQT